MSATVPTDPLPSPTLQEVMEESQDPLATVPPMKKYLLEQRVSVPSTSPETPAPIEATTTTSLEEMRCDLSVKRYTPTANKILGEVFWLIKNIGRTGKTFSDVTIVCASIWEKGGRWREFTPTITVGMLNEDLIGVCYMTEMFTNMLRSKKTVTYDEWLEEITSSRPANSKTTLIATIAAHATAAIDMNYNAFDNGVLCSVYQRRCVRRVTDIAGGMHNNFNACLSSNTARFTYAIVRSVIA